MKYKIVLFDLDGTLTDPQVGICTCINKAINFFGKDMPLKALTKYIGPPLLGTFVELLGEELAPQGVAKYRERYSTVGLYENEIYEGVEETLIELKNMGFTLCTASSKPQVYVEKILQHFNIAQYFDIIGGASLDGKISDKKDVIQHVLSLLNANKKDVVMVGDTRYDLIGAKEIGIDAIGVTYGFAEEGELLQYPNIAVIDSITELVNIIK